MVLELQVASSTRFTELFSHWFNIDSAHHQVWCALMSVKLRNKSEEVFSMTKTRHGEYQIYKFYNKELDHYETEFFLPDDSLRRTAERLMKLASYKESGYQIAGILYVNKESYLNARLADTVEDYIYMDKLEREAKEKFEKGLMSLEVYTNTVVMIQDYKWTLLKKLKMQVDRMIRADFEVENEIAIQLYDQFMQVIL